MDGGESATHDASHDGLPFRLSDVKIEPKFFDFHPLILNIRQELLFQWKLIRTDWNPQFTLAAISALIAVLLGSLNVDIFDGGNAKIAGLEGLQDAGSTAYFLSLIHI